MYHRGRPPRQDEQGSTIRRRSSFIALATPGHAVQHVLNAMEHRGQAFTAGSGEPSSRCRGPMITIKIVNESTVLNDSKVVGIIPALQEQVDEFLAAWRNGPPPAVPDEARTVFVPKAQWDGADRAADDAWWLVVLDDTDHANELGYHDRTPGGAPLGKVFVRSDLRLGLEWTVTASHELLEMLADPQLEGTVDGPHGRTYALEVCDPCQDSSLAYEQGTTGVLVSDYLLPAWFDPHGSAPFHRNVGQNVITGSFAIPAGGYISVRDPAAADWKQLYENDSPKPPAPRNGYGDRPYVGSRRERRRTPREAWLDSELHADEQAVRTTALFTAVQLENDPQDGPTTAHMEVARSLIATGQSSPRAAGGAGAGGGAGVGAHMEVAATEISGADIHLLVTGRTGYAAMVLSAADAREIIGKLQGAVDTPGAPVGP
jgi:hypothetical protein